MFMKIYISNYIVFFLFIYMFVKIVCVIGESIGMGRRIEIDFIMDENSSLIEIKDFIMIIVVFVYVGRVVLIVL